MPLDEGAVRRGCAGSEVRADNRHLCRSQLDRFRAALAEGRPITVACTQEAPLFEEVAAEAGHTGEIVFANIREQAGWSVDAAAAGPKMAALVAASAVPMPTTAFVSLQSLGVALVYGRDSSAIEVARGLMDDLDVTVILTRPGEVVPPRVGSFPVLKGTIVAASGHLGAFELKVDDYAHPAPSSRDRLVFGPARDGATSQCDIVIDLTGGTPLFPAHELRPGYLRADPRDPAAVARLVARAATLTGTFDKPRYVTYEPELCAHSRSKKTGCTRCLDLCPTGAITPDGDHVAISAEICAGCGACASVCPTGAASYALPPADALMRRLRTLLLTYAEAGGREPVLLVHDAENGAPLIDALARHGDGLPANVLPLAVNEVTQIDLAFLAAAFAHGASAVRFLTRARPKHEIGGLVRNLDYADAILAAMGFGANRAALLQTDDPDALRAELLAIPLGTPVREPARFLALGSGRPLLRQTVAELRLAAPAPAEIVPMPAGAPFGKVDVDVEGCTLCLACVSACPVSALTDDPERPTLKFQEDLCVQCGLCAATCPEKVISLVPQIDFAAWEKGPVVVKQEEPFHCIQCGKAFGTKSTIERIAAKLENRHWMFSGDQAKRISVIRMCEDCRVEVVVNESFDPHQNVPRPAPRTSEDYLRERAEREALGVARDESDPLN